MPSDAFPKWLAEEIQSASFKDSENWEGSGYILEIDSKGRKIDVQFYEKLPAGRYIATLEIPESLKMDSLEQAIVYMFKFKAFKSSLSEKATTFLKGQYGIDMDSIFRFELESAEKLDAEASPPPREEAGGGDDGEE